MTNAKPNFKRAKETLYGFENVRWYMANIEGADVTDCLVTEDGYYWFKHTNPVNGETLISDAPDYIHEEDADYVYELTEWVGDMLEMGVFYVFCGDCENHQHAIEKFKVEA